MSRKTTWWLFVGLTAIAVTAFAVAQSFKLGLLAALFGDSATATTATTQTRSRSTVRTSSTTSIPSATTQQQSSVKWIVAAPGRVEPRTGEVRVAPAIVGRILEVRVAAGDRVEEGDLLARLEDEEARAKLDAAEAEAAARRRERDAGPLVSGRDDVRRTEDAVANAERAVFDVRSEFDNLVRNRATADAITAARNRLRDARDRLQRDRDAWRAAQNRANLPIANRLESALTAARADVWAAQALLERTRVRSPLKGSVLQVNAKVGELSAPQSELALVTVGDTTALRVKAELEERDVAKVRIGQKIFVRSEAYPGRDFGGTVTVIAPALGPPRMAVRTTRRASDVDVLEVTVELTPGSPLLPGMRVDVFFQP
ncbi:MAG: HlyD family efflux transporter periplasmic adaptor subunit [Hyphomicrobiaceae bacterium]|nr:MAG: HlyD family efflux transporter periplasmic adaptor subunit [Hyphomicrobiaceae bacterium]